MPYSKLSTKDVERWRVRIRHVLEVYKRMGLTGNSRASTMRALLDFYRGKHWSGFPDGWCGLGERELATVNKIYSTANTIQAVNASRNPQVQVFPRTESSVAGARSVEHLHNYDIEELNMIRPFNAALRDHCFAPLGIVRHGFTPRSDFYDKEGCLIENYGSARPDKPWIKRMPIWDCLLDPLGESFHHDGGGWWVAFRSVMTMKQIEKTPGMVKRDGIKPNVGRDWKDMRLEELADDQNPDFGDLVEVYTVYEKRERTWFQITLDESSKPLRDVADWPIPWETLPYNVFCVNEQMDSPFPIPLLEQILPQQMELNKVRSIMSLLARNLRRIVGVQEGGIEPAEFEKMVDGDVIEFFRTKGIPSQVLQQITVGGFPQELLLYDDLIEEDMRETIGQGKMDRAQRINVSSATEAARVGQGSDIQSARIQSAFEKFMQDTLRLYAQARSATIQEDELIPILGGEGAAAGAAPFIKVSVDDLHGEYNFHIVVGSTLPKDRQREAQAALADLQVATQFPQLANIPEHMRLYYEARGKDPSKMMTNPEMRAATDADLMQRGAGGPPEGGSTGAVDPIVAQLLGGQAGGIQ